MENAAPLIDRQRTAMARTFLSRPARLLLEDGLVSAGATVFDYGCGRGGDVGHLQALGIDAAGWDPSFAPENPILAADVVNLGFVVNVIEDPHERAETLARAWKLARGLLVVSARLSWEAGSLAGEAHADGIVTAARTFQKFFTQEELRAWVDTTLNVKAIAAAPGVFYVFRRQEDAQHYLAGRARASDRSSGIRVADLLYEQHRSLLEPLERFVREHRRLPATGECSVEAELVRILGSVRAAFGLIRRATGTSQWSDVDFGGRERSSDRRFRQHQELLEPLLEFLAQRGRLPRTTELASGAEIENEFGSVRAAFALVRRVTGPDRWKSIEDEAKRDFLVYLALSVFGGRPRVSDLPEDLRFDVRDFFGNYKEACQQADRLLFATGDRAAIEAAIRSAPFGKLTPEALYVHVVGLSQLPAVLRVYEGCARTLTGDVEEATILKMHRIKTQVSYLGYPRFDEDAHPALSTVVIGRLSKLDVTFRDFRASANPPILHRKETFVPPDYPGREKFARLTAQQERRGLLDDAAGIGTTSGWHERLTDLGLEVRGHRLVQTH